MAVRVEVPYEKAILCKHPLKETFDYFANVEKSVPANFPGVEAFESLGKDTYRWVFESVGYKGYELQIKLVTRFTKTPDESIEVTPVSEPGTSLFTGSWRFTPEGANTRMTFKAKFEIELPVPGFLKAVAAPLAQSELTKLFDRYIARVEKNFG